ncbi:hypothetical protein GS8_2846 [Geobacillus stearothermophilus]|uniref:Uncharacterized protein n=1 Tax=Geobacillus stearothermophilus TaxID=1422 RepID=A0ABQ7HEP9_GEOSE|nr:hypothetical protein GS8_2846 [Geobacillus stearothermophilus]
MSSPPRCRPDGNGLLRADSRAHSRGKGSYCLYMTAGVKKTDEHFSLYEGYIHGMITYI